MSLIHRNTVNLLAHILCLFTLVYAAVQCYLDYIKNEDLSEVSFKKYQSKIDSVYPSLSICFMSPFLQERLRKYGSMAYTSVYESYLSGSYDKEQQLLNISYEDVSIRADDFLIYTYVKGNVLFDSGGNGTMEIRNITSESWPWYSTKMMKCFTLHVPFQKDATMRQVGLTFRKDIFPGGIRPTDGFTSGGLHLYLHYPEQFARSWARSQRIWPLHASGKGGYQMRFYLKSMEVIDRRSKPNDQCQVVKRYDGWLKEHIMSTVKCRPPYWKPVGNTTVCKTTKELLRVKQEFWNVFYGAVDLNTPCREIKKLDMESFERVSDRIDKQHISLQVFFLSLIHI